jgi:uncharacterized protein YcbK (DUF882 family)
LRRCLLSLLLLAFAATPRPAAAAMPDLGAAGTVPATVADAAAAGGRRAESRLRLFNTHTGERVDVAFRSGASYLPEGLAELASHLRDFRRNESRELDPRLYDLLADLAAAVGRPDAEFHVISGYRSPATNSMLRERSLGVAQRSLHMEGRAIDVRLPGVPTAVLRDAALKLARGGVGYYAESDFIHVDTGRVRRW